MCHGTLRRQPPGDSKEGVCLVGSHKLFLRQAGPPMEAPWGVRGPTSGYAQRESSPPLEAGGSEGGGCPGPTEVFIQLNFSSDHNFIRPTIRRRPAASIKLTYADSEGAVGLGGNNDSHRP